MRVFTLCSWMNCRVSELEGQDDESVCVCAADPMSDPTLAGLMAISEESLKCAENALNHWKGVGNDHFREGERIRGRLDDAIDAYSRGLEVPESADFKTLRAQLWSNRANCHYKLKRYVQCIEDARHAILEDPNYVKGYYHAANASLSLLLYKQCISFCEAAESACGFEPSIEAIKKKATETWDRIQLNRSRSKHNESDSVALELKKRNINFSPNSDYNHPQCGPPQWHNDAEGELVWSVLLLIREYSIAEVARVTDSLTIQQLLQEIFTEIAPWDTRRDYKPNRIIVSVLKPDDTRIKVPHNITIKDIIDKHLNKIIHQHLVFELTAAEDVGAAENAVAAAANPSTRS